ncbi:MAG: DUF3015 domain-containing protein [candidate division Zixibacteria bacterium]|nr:DUF3015 domain-containing protein [candidate division Zixibacteria bacterium]
MKKLLVVGIALLTLISFSSPIWAAGYGESGCGLGSLIFNKSSDHRSPVIQILSATTNGTFGNQTFGITTGTSNCQDSLMKAEVEREVFATANHNTLVKEMAEGEGESLNTLASLYGCSQDSYSDFGSMTQNNFSEIVKGESTSTKDILNSLKQQIIDNEKLSQSCTKVIG